MFKHEEIWIAIDRLADSAGYSTSGLAKKAGLDPTAFNRSKRMSPEGKPRWPSTESLSKILTVTNVTMDQFITLIRVEQIQCDTEKEQGSHAASIPMISVKQAAGEGYFDDRGLPVGMGWDSLALDGLLVQSGALLYALEVSDDAMAPLYHQGDTVIVAPAAAIKKGDRVVVKTTEGTVLIRVLARRTTTLTDLKAINPAYPAITLSNSDIVWIARIALCSQ